MTGAFAGETFQTQTTGKAHGRLSGGLDLSVRCPRHRFDPKSRFRPDGLLTREFGSQEKSDAAAQFRGELQPAADVVGQFVDIGKHGRHAGAAQRLFQGPVQIQFRRGASENQPIKIDTHPGRGKRTKFPGRIDDDQFATFGTGRPSRRQGQRAGSRTGLRGDPIDQGSPAKPTAGQQRVDRRRSAGNPRLVIGARARFEPANLLRKFVHRR